MTVPNRVRGPEARARLGAELRRLYDAGATLAQIGQQYGRSPNWARELILEAGGTMRPEGGVRQKRGPGKSRTAGIGVPMYVRGPEARAEMGAKLRALYERGLSTTAIAARFGRRATWARVLILEAGGTMRAKGTPRQQPGSVAGADIEAAR